MLCIPSVSISISSGSHALHLINYLCWRRCQTAPGSLVRPFRLPSAGFACRPRGRVGSRQVCSFFPSPENMPVRGLAPLFPSVHLAACGGSVLVDPIPAKFQLFHIREIGPDCM